MERCARGGVSVVVADVTVSPRKQVYSCILGTSVNATIRGVPSWRDTRVVALRGGSVAVTERVNAQLIMSITSLMASRGVSVLRMAVCRLEWLALLVLTTQMCHSALGKGTVSVARVSVTEGPV